jgi:antitoxin component YwqK of YwqJK toxin-antitoxin module
MKFILLLFLCFSFKIVAQNCEFNYYNKKGGHYLFSTYYLADMTTRREGVCESFINGKLYERRIFSNGRLIEEELNNPDLKPRVRYKLDTNPKDSIISVLTMYDESGKLTEKWIFYENKEKRRCQKTIQYIANGKEHYITHRAWIKDTEIDQYLRPQHPPHTIDEDGYTSMSVPIGEEIAYHSNGKLASINYHKFVITYYPDEVSKEGPLLMYFDNGKPHVKGQYKDGKAEGKFLNYYPTGELAEEKYFHQNIHVGTWKGWYTNGKKKYVEVYDSLSRDPFNPSIVRWWNENGILVKEKIVDRDGNGYEKLWHDNGKPLLHEDIYSFQRYQGMRWDWGSDGKLMRFQDKTPRADTALLINFTDGKPNKRITNQVLGDTLITLEQEWYPDGKPKLVLQLAMTPGMKWSQRTEFYPNGSKKQETLVNGNQRTETSIYPNGALKEFREYENNILTGTYKHCDSLGVLLEEMNYLKGLRHGNFSLYNSGGKLFLIGHYTNGCLDTNFEEVPVQPATEPDSVVMDLLRKMALSMNIEKVRTQLGIKIVSKEAIDSTIILLTYLYKEWQLEKSNLTFPFSTQHKAFPEINFTLPVSQHNNLNQGDFSHPNTLRLVKIFDSLEWVFPVNWTKTDQYYQASYRTEDLYSSQFIIEVFKEWCNLGQVYYGPMHYTEIDYGLRKYRPYGSEFRFGVDSGSPCATIFELTGYSVNGGNASFVVYQDGSVEPRDRAFDWKELKEPDWAPGYNMYED